MAANDETKNKLHTMIRNSVNPFIERRVKLCNYLLLPLLPNKTKQDFQLVDRILPRIISKEFVNLKRYTL